MFAVQSSFTRNGLSPPQLMKHVIAFIVWSALSDNSDTRKQKKKKIERR